MNLSENVLDETETNIETDEECLSDIMKNWLGYHDPSMEVLNYALSHIDERPIIFDGSLKGNFRWLHVHKKNYFRSHNKSLCYVTFIFTEFAVVAEKRRRKGEE